jgi:hypothetical protein
VNDNKLLQRTNSDFVEFINSKGVESGKDYSITDWAKEFKELYYGDDSDFSTRMFGNFLNTYAKIKGMTITRRKSDGKVLAKFSENTNK